MNYNKSIKSTVTVPGRSQVPAPGCHPAGAESGPIGWPVTERKDYE